VMMGFAASSKIVGAFTLAGSWCLVAVLLARPDRACAARLRDGLRFVAVSALVGAPWYVRAWVETGDPIWPTLQPWLGGIDGSAALFRELAHRLTLHTVLPRDVGGFVAGPWALLAGSPALFRRTLLGPLFLLGLPLLLLRREQAKRCVWLLGFALAVYPVWFLAVHEGRYLASVFGALSVAAAAGLAAGAATGPRARRVILGSVVLWSAVSFAAAVSQLAPFVPYLAGREDAHRMLGRVASYHAELRWMNAHLPADAVVASDWPALFYLERRSVWLADLQAFFDYEAYPDVEAFAQAARRRGVTHLFLTETTDDLRASGIRDGLLPDALARRCGRVVLERPDAVVVRSVTLRARETGRARVVALRPDCP